jgi:signal transduction histidine kinase
MRFSDHLRQCWRTHEKQIIDLDLQIKGHPGIPVQLSTIAAEVPEKADWICRTVLIDITERRRAEAQLQIAREELEQRVAERTAELAEAISALQQEVVERKEAQEGRHRLFRELVTAQEEERRRISRELHDQMGQHLTALILGLKSIQGILQSETQLSLLRDLQNLTDDIGRQVHRIAFELRPTALDDLGLSSMLLNYMDEWSARFGIGVDFHSGGLDEERLPTEIETTIYRIVQEALTNVVKHAAATQLSLILVRGEDHLLAIIEDNGKGFEVDKISGGISGPHHLGLLGMKERVALAGGTFELESSVGQGTALFIRIPLPSGLKENSL